MNNIVICFLGIDGSGKSTLSNYLCNELRKRELNVSYTWWLEGDNSLIRRFLKKIGKNFQPPSNNILTTNSKKLENGKNRGLLLKIFNNTFPWLVTVDYFKFTLLNLTIPRKLRRKRVIIFDRFYLDVVLAIYREFNLSKSTFYKIINIFKKLAGTPDIIFFVHVKPERALSRKKDEIKTLENAYKIYDNYQEIYSLINKIYPENIININGNDDLEIVKSKILSYSLKTLRD